MPECCPQSAELNSVHHVPSQASHPAKCHMHFHQTASRKAPGACFSKTTSHKTASRKASLGITESLVKPEIPTSDKLRKEFDNLSVLYTARVTCVTGKCLWVMRGCRNAPTHSPPTLSSVLESSPSAWTIGCKLNTQKSSHPPWYLTFREFLQVQIDSMLGSEHSVAGEGRRPGEVCSYLEAEQSQGNGHL